MAQAVVELLHCLIGELYTATSLPNNNLHALDTYDLLSLNNQGKLISK